MLSNFLLSPPGKDGHPSLFPCGVGIIINRAPVVSARATNYKLAPLSGEAGFLSCSNSPRGTPSLPLFGDQSGKQGQLKQRKEFLGKEQRRMIERPAS